MIQPDIIWPTAGTHPLQSCQMGGGGVLIASGEENEQSTGYATAIFHLFVVRP